MLLLSNKEFKLIIKIEMGLITAIEITSFINDILKIVSGLSGFNVFKTLTNIKKIEIAQDFATFATNIVNVVVANYYADVLFFFSSISNHSSNYVTYDQTNNKDKKIIFSFYDNEGQEQIKTYPLYKGKLIYEDLQEIATIFETENNSNFNLWNSLNRKKFARPGKIV